MWAMKHNLFGVCVKWNRDIFHSQVKEKKLKGFFEMKGDPRREKGNVLFSDLQ